MSSCPNNQLPSIKTSDMTCIKKSKNILSFIYLCYWQKDQKLQTSFPALQTLRQAENSLWFPSLQSTELRKLSVRAVGTYPCTHLVQPGKTLWCWSPTPLQNRFPLGSTSTAVYWLTYQMTSLYSVNPANSIRQRIPIKTSKRWSRR